MDFLRKALERISQFEIVPSLSDLEQIFLLIQSIIGRNNILKRISSCSDLNQIEDYLTEIRFALFFRDIGFAIEVEPFGGEGPDLKITKDNKELIIEITRLRKINPGPPELFLTNNKNILPKYGSPERDVKKIISKIMGKYSQIERDVAIISIWNDDGDIEECEMRWAVNSLIEDSKNGFISVPSNLLLILYGSKWLHWGKRFYCFPLVESLPPYIKNWIQQFEASRNVRL